ncbi:hypothetical protein SELMODRAFT_415465 [Selaginella moellendorffii]|uniref:Uncharacterized protein n=1 Tax=Selaginella moellendorffii TaxID=88036 RepID=D8RW72_SELML|nr:formin-like protein 1 [Selaginella moellendorffii]EFJ23497.1 hypothetical protein SELMODRAFT_415465 [Selaginella moellendorffii]|eukprot:XP_002975296.1 formin-like protein 1 [Selaginella moellendorffii]
MASVGALGIGLSIVFGVFLVLLLAELYYLLFWKRRSLIASSRVTSASVAPNDPSRPEVVMGEGGGGGGSTETAFVAKMFESRGLGSQIGMMLDGGECVLAPPRLLFTIKEEAREDLVDSAEDALKSSSIRLKRGCAGHVVVEVIQPDVPDVRERERGLLHVCSSSSCEESGSSSSSGASEDQDLGDHRPAAAVTEISLAVDRPPLPAAAVVDVIEEEEEMSSATPFVTPPSSPAFSTPPSSPDRPQIWARPPPPPRPPRLSYESPPSPPLLPMPVPVSSDAPPAAMTPLSVSSSSPGRRSSSRATASACSRDSFSSAAAMRSSRQSP